MGRAPFQPGVVGVPRDDGDAEVARKLEEVLRRGGAAPVRLVVHHVQDGGHVRVQELLAQRVQDGWNGETGGKLRRVM